MILPNQTARMQLGRVQIRRVLLSLQPLVLVWLVLRVGTTLWAAAVSTLRPMHQREAAIPVWPPSTPGTGWLERVFLAPWERWDTKYYLWIVDRGYRVDDGTAQFHPLLAWLATPLAWLTGSPLLALLLISSTAGLLMLLAFERLARIDADQATARVSTLLLLVSPLAFVLFAPYTEPLFLLCAVLSLLAARRGAWWWASFAAGLAVLTRQQGLFLGVPLVWELWEASGRSWRTAVRNWRHWLSLFLLPLALTVWLLFRAAVLGDLRASFDNLQSFIFSLLISPSASKVVPVQAFLPPWQALYNALVKMWQAPELSLGVDLIFGAGFLVLLALAWPRLRVSYRLYAAAIALVSFGYYTGPFYPYMGLPRHLLLAFPVFIGLGPAVRGTRLQPLLLALGIAGMLFLTFLYVIEGWTP